MSDNVIKLHKCPICGKMTDDEKYRPFCSKRCADVDLGNWLTGKYAVPATEVDEEDIAEMEDFLNKESPEDKQP